jgi:hypothetical protein
VTSSLGEAEPVEVRLPGGLIGELCLRFGH